MKNQTARTFLLLGLAILLFAAATLWDPPGKLQDFMTGGSAGLGLAGCISFIMLLAKQFKK